MDTDEQVFTALYRRHYRHIERYVRRRLIGEVTRDAVAEVFLVAWRRLDEIPSGAALPWLYTVASNVVANQSRGAQRAEFLRARIEQQPVPRPPDPANDVVDQLAVAEVFDALPALSQEILRLVGWEGLSVSEAASVVGCSASAATMRLHRARRQAREAIEAAAASDYAVRSGLSETEERS
jgi:RNA polymerase sigma factor (sigma-70 family)